MSENTAKCLECGKKFEQERDIQLCDKCVDKFDLDKLWDLHDKNKLDALDFNERKSVRERFRLTQNNIKEEIIDNFIIFWTSDEKERKQMRKKLKIYLKDEE